MRLLPLFAFAIALSTPAVAAETIALPGFDSVQLRGGGTVMLRHGPVQRVTLVEGSSRFTQVRVIGHGELRIEACNERCPRLYKLQVLIESPRVPDLAVSGGGSITSAAGFAPQQQLAAAVNGGGKIDVRSAPVRAVSAAVNGGGEILAQPRVTLAAAVHGGGRIRYWGNPQVSSAIMGGGSVQRAE